MDIGPLDQGIVRATLKQMAGSENRKGVYTLGWEQIY